jgi:arsenate reductase
MGDGRDRDGSPVRGDRPVVLFVCVHNAGRSQMAAAFLEELGGDRVDVRSAGTAPAEEVHGGVRATMAEVGIDLGNRQPARLETSDVREADVVVTMGCGDECPFYPGKRYEDWDLPDPSGRAVEEVRAIRDQIRGRVKELLASLPA